MIVTDWMIVFLLTWLASLASIRFFMLIADRIGLVDYPDERKQHQYPTPVIGGIGSFFVFALAAFLLMGWPDGQAGLLVAIALMLVTGLLDDLRNLTASTRFIMQTLTALMMTVLIGQVSISSLGDLFGWGEVTLDFWSVPFTVFCIVGVINALNMIDGLDGLAGGLALNTIIWLIVLVLPTHQHDHVLLLLVLSAAAILGFLYYNLRLPWRSRAIVFMGDSGSMMLGVLLAWFLISLSQGQDAAFPPILAPWLFAVPLMDTVSLMIWRARHGQNPLRADRRHIHHLLLESGFSPGQVTLVLVAMAVLLAGAGVLGWRLGVPDYVLFYGFWGVFLVYTGVVNFGWRRLRDRQEAEDGLT